MKNIVYQSISPLREDVLKLMARLNAHNLSHCAPEICHQTTATELAESDSVLIGAFSGEQLCGMGAIKLMGSYGEITRMFVDEPFRSRGIARRILSDLIQIAIDREMRSVKLETSERFTNAVQLYISAGFVRCEPFGEYVHAPYNTYMERKI